MTPLNKDIELSEDDACQSAFSTPVGERPSRERKSSYTTLLGAPVSEIAANVPDRPDVSWVAILGYN